MRNLVLLCVLLAGCDDSPTEPLGTIGGAFDLTAPTAEVRFARISLDPYGLTYLHERVTADGLTASRGTFSYNDGSLAMTPDAGEPYACTFDGYRVLRCPSGTYRMIP